MPKRVFSRRAFIRMAMLGGIGAGVAYIQHQTSEMGLLNFLRWSIRGQLKKLEPAAVVGLGRCDSYDADLHKALRDLWAISEMPAIQGKSILVKPNMLDQVDENIATTHPLIIAALIDLLGELGASKVSVGDGSAFRRDTYSVARSCGLAQVLDSRGIPFIDLNYDELVPVDVHDGWIRNTTVLWLPQHVVQADLIISVPKLKAHHWAGVTLGLKNLLGVIPGSRYGWAKNIIHINGINATILGLYQSLPPVISVVDGIIGMQGNGPLGGTPVQHGLLAMGSDPLAVDTTCAQLMGFSIEAIPHLHGAALAGIGQANKIETRGVPASQLQQHYEAPPTL